MTCKADMLHIIFAIGAFILGDCTLTGINALRCTVLLIYCDSGSSLSFLSSRSGFCQSRIYRNHPVAQRPGNTTYAIPSAAYSSIWCAPPLPRERPISTVKGRCGYSLTVVHFRKIVNSTKIGSPENRHPVI